VTTSTPTTAEQFLELVAQSGLLSREVLQQYSQRRTPNDPEAHRGLATLLVKDRLLTPFQATQLLAGKHRGYFLADKYKILGLIGTGGTGHVFLCEHLVLQRLVAVKMLQNRAAEMTHGGQAAALERFVREARAVAALDHPNIVRVYDMERSGAIPFMVMEYVDGTSLHQIVAHSGTLSIQRAAHYTSQAAIGLQHAHEHGLIHRDIKPGNLLLDRSGLVKILDLGLARFLRDTGRNDNLTGRYNDDNSVVGTVDYMSPEQAVNSPHIDIRSDIYSLGATFYYLLAGRAPFEDETITQKLVSHQLREPVAIESLRSDMPRALAAVLRKMMAKKQDERYQTPAEVAEALTPWTRTRTVLPPPPAGEMPKHPTASYRLGLSPNPSSSESGTEVNAARRWDFPLATGTVHDGGETPRATQQQTALDKSQSVVVELLEPTAPVSTAARRVAEGASPRKKRRAQPILMGLTAALAVLLAAGFWWQGIGKPTDPRGNPSGPGPGVPPPPTAIVLKGSGSTFIKPAMDHWLPLYEKQTGVKIEYTGIGSGRGVANMVDKVLDFGCTDAFMTDAELAKARDANGEVVHIPLAMGAVVATYTLPDVEKQLRFTGPVLADIYLGKITKWNHGAIAACNPGVALPDLAITVVHRSDSSGTTFIWTDYLNKASPAEWAKVGVGNVVKWPVGQGADKNQGVAKAVLQTKGAIGYVELSFALERNLKFARVQNQNGFYIEPTLESVTAAANASLRTIPADLRYTLTDAPGDDSYPIAGTAWVVVYVNQSGARGRELVKFLRWTAREGQEHLKALRYAPLPPTLVARIDETLAKIRVAE
jgi:phosphate ABC transporter phosphate-binding protein